MVKKKQIEEAGLYYLFMMSDGKLSDNEERIFDDICKKMEMSENEKQAVISHCREVSRNFKSIAAVIARERLDDDLRVLNKSARTIIVWNLVNLGYADDCYSDEEKNIVGYLVKEWNIPEAVYREMVDVADTMLALSKQRDWLIATYSEGNARDKKEKEIEAEIESLVSDVKVTIEEQTM